ncbi:protein of unknown function [Taphrina deformans PYCC 5710]|uniref:Uncharacterized protein n=1 Tax=Taphrina deformans (strain PYCC 5710 / ATCC 11124 / CBS 356.35 / IMI 108563 / JCM 9778 / NBRC 8474) TaxID=1097556 RepID=R4XA35_TAPDE|nr:protein of unknown function [Taphrina deformans PYCC 5710]|eukprot:CCG82653.1 protein of unknown function [Taphrina deformans PYCC 5710]
MKSGVTISEDRALSAFGFTKTRSYPSIKRKAISADISEIEDSQFDANYCPITPRKKLKREAVSSPAKASRSDNFNTHSSDGAPTSPLALDAQHITTPRVSRFIEHDGSDTIASPEIPSSLAYERYHYEAWLKETPVRKRVHHYTGTGLIASPPASSPYGAHDNDAHLNRVSPISSRWLRTPAGFRDQLDTPPPTHPGHNLNQDVVHSSQMAADTVEHSSPGNRLMRVPLRELDPSCVFRSHSRRVLHDNDNPTSNSFQSNSFSIREDSPTEWFDAVETMTPQRVRERSWIYADEQLVDGKEQVTRLPKGVLSRDNTVQDSQFDEALEPLPVNSEEPLFSDTDPHAQKDEAMSSEQSQAHSWQLNNSLLNTLLPPGYRSSQYGPETQIHDYSSELCALPPSSTHASSSPISKRKFSPDDFAALSMHKKVKHDTLPSDELAPQSSWEQDNSLMYTLLQQPPSSLPSTAE